MVYSYVQNGNIHSAIRMANVAAAISVTRAGASTSIPTLQEVLDFREKKKATEMKIKPITDARAKAEAEKTVAAE
jgi:bifunctional ADP-heptose synthase (sugar kinase/adenylyltransferase)